MSVFDYDSISQMHTEMKYIIYIENKFLLFMCVCYSISQIINIQ